MEGWKDKLSFLLLYLSLLTLTALCPLPNQILNIPMVPFFSSSLYYLNPFSRIIRN